ncbi:MAG: substrate-binding domain-containing protein [Oscillospiraceae bacterium]|nr:substrate-binding domain-containing protein [Oscillospiraceae bacterium]
MKILAILLVFLAFLLVGCENNGEEESSVEENQALPEYVEEIPDIELPLFTFTQDNMPRISGSPALAPLAEAAKSVLLAEPREAARPHLAFTRTAEAFRNLAAGESDIILVSELSPSLIDELPGLNVIMQPIALDALVFIVCPTNPVDNLSTEQLRGIFSGEITNWQQVGGNDIEISGFQRNEESASRVLAERLVMAGQQMVLRLLPSYATEFDDDFLISAMRGFDGSPGAIGYAFLHSVENSGFTDGVKILSIDGINPEYSTIASGNYPFTNNYYAVIIADEPQDSSTRILFNWLLSEDGQYLMDFENYVPISESLNHDITNLPEMSVDVETNFSALTSFEPIHSNFSGFISLTLNELLPSNDYGTLLPYAGTVTLSDGSIETAGYGFVTTEGVLVTNLIFDEITRATYNSASGAEPRPAYSLRILSHDTGEFGYSEAMAVTALDGSWVTPFEYVSVAFSDEVMFLVREFDTFNIDVLDYSGQQLYNMLDLDWIDRISEDYWAELLLYNVSEGVVFIPLTDGRVGLMDALTGELRETEFYGALNFSEGLAAVLTNISDGLWGFANKDLELIIESRFIIPTVFRGGRAAVMTVGGNEHIIDISGEIIFSAPEGYMIVMHQDSSGFSVFSMETWDTPRFYSNDFVEITSLANPALLGSDPAIKFLGNGWHTALVEDGVWLFDGETEIMLSEHRYIIEVVQNYIIFSESDLISGRDILGVMHTDGTELITPTNALNITPIIDNTGVRGFILNTNAIGTHFIEERYTTAVYKLFDTSGNLLKTDLGVLIHDATTNLIHAVGTNYFAWLDLTGSVIVSIPLMGYSFD